MRRKILVLSFMLFLLYSCWKEELIELDDCPCNTIDVNECYMTPCSWEQKKSDNPNIIIKEKIVTLEEKLENEKIDEHNFEQLEKVKEILDWITNENYNFENLNDFNSLFNVNLEPKGNTCYYLNSNNGDFPYIFWFQLFSKKYKNKYKDLYRWEYIKDLTKLFNESGFTGNYWVNYYFYPWYNKRPDPFCDWWSICDDLTFLKIKEIITKPCEN
jgi:hypothetical protein